MRYFFLFLAAFLNLSIIFGQVVPNDTINRTDSIGRKQGYWIKKDRDGTLKYEGRFVNDRPTGTFKYYYPEKTVKAITIFGKNGYSRTIAYHPNGKVLSEGCYNNTLKDSVWNFYNEYGKHVSQESYNKGSKNGIWRIYYVTTGKISDEVNWKDNERNGNWNQFFEDGSTKVKGTFRNGHIDGLFQSFYPNGKVEQSGTYKLSLKDGVWISFADNGESNYKETYKMGNLKKKEMYFKAEGKIKDIEAITVALAYNYQGKVRLLLKSKDLIVLDDDIDRVDFLLGQEKFSRINKNAIVGYDVIKGLQVYNEQLLKVITSPEAEIELIADQGSSEFLISRYKVIK